MEKNQALFAISGNIVDVVNRTIFPGTVTVRKGSIISIQSEPNKKYSSYILPGFIDSHVHVESSMLVPSEFARLAVIHGTVATVSDPHEIGNVLGIQGIRYMIYNGSQVPFHFYFGASSCVPATPFETAGATISAHEIRELFLEDKLKYLSEMMNFPGVLARDPRVMEKIAIAKSLQRPVDGHSPGLRGEQTAAYIAAGITTDHECFALDEALDKAKYGMKILIREGSAAKNYNALHPIIKSHPEMVMFCSDDKHHHELVKGSINELVRRSIVEHGYDLMDVLRCASYNPIFHYALGVGLLQMGDRADFIVVDNLHDFHVLETYIHGHLVAKDGQTLIQSIPVPPTNHFDTNLKRPGDFALKARGDTIQIIEALDGQLITNKIVAPAKIENGFAVSDTERDILKLAVVNRYQEAPVALGFVKNFGLKKGALASCIAHDSHNIIAVGVSDHDICEAVNALIKSKGGIAVYCEGLSHTLPLPIAGIMSDQDGYLVAKQYSTLDAQAKELGSKLQAPFMTLSFMALLVIPSLKLSDKGLFDVSTFTFTDLFCQPEKGQHVYDQNDQHRDGRQRTGMV